MALAVALVVASAAYACVGYENTTKFDVKDATGTTDATKGKVGDKLVAVGTNIERPNHPYAVKLFAAPWVTEPKSMKARCGNLGTLQTVARTTGTGGFSGTFRQEFTLTYEASGLSLGPVSAHFCAIPYPIGEPLVTSSLGPLTPTESPYIYEPFTLAVL